MAFIHKVCLCKIVSTAVLAFVIVHTSFSLTLFAFFVMQVQCLHILLNTIHIILFTLLSNAFHIIVYKAPNLKSQTSQNTSKCNISCNKNVMLVKHSLHKVRHVSIATQFLLNCLHFCRRPKIFYIVLNMAIF